MVHVWLVGRRGWFSGWPTTMQCVTDWHSLITNKMYIGNPAYLLIPLFATLVSAESLSCRPVARIQGQFPLNVLVLVPLPDEDFDPAFDQGYSIIPAVELAAEQINRRTDILPGINLMPNVKDAGCDKPSKTALEAVKLLRELLSSMNGPLGIIGPACSEDSIFIANTFNITYELPVLYSGTTPYLSEYSGDTPNAHGMISSATVLIDALFKIADKEEWNWENIAIVYDESRQHFQQIYDAFVMELRTSGQGAGYTRQMVDSQIPLTDILERNIRIVVVFAGKIPARQLACLAGQSDVNFVFPVRQFFFIERSLEDFLGDENAEPSFMQRSEGKRYYCNRETVMRGLNGSVLLNQALDSVDPDAVTVSNYTAEQVKEQYRERLSECGSNMDPPAILKESRYAYPYYDAMWVIAHGLQYASKLPYVSFQKFIRDVNNAIQNNVSFQGVSGWIDFKEDHHVSNPVDIEQVHESTAILESVRLNNESELSHTFISDRFAIVKVVLHPALTTLGFLIISLTFLLTVTMHFFNTYLQKYPSVKASSPKLNHFIFIGCYLLVFALFINTLRRVIPDLTGTVLCNLDVMFIILGYCLIFATIFAKSWRTYRIFCHPFESHKFLRDSTLSILIAILVIIQILLLVPFLAVSPFHKDLSLIIDSSSWPPVEKLTTTCVNQSISYIVIPLLFQFLLTMAEVFLATLNRNIKHTNFRTTKQILVLTYVLAIMWLLGGSLLVIFYLVNYSMNIIYLTYASLLIFTVILCQTTLLAPALALAANAKWDLCQWANSQSGSWLKKSFSRYTSRTVSMYTQT